jgi:hypothetical protein
MSWMLDIYTDIIIARESLASTSKSRVRTSRVQAKSGTSYSSSSESKSIEGFPCSAVLGKKCVKSQNAELMDSGGKIFTKKGCRIGEGNMSVSRHYEDGFGFVVLGAKG